MAEIEFQRRGTPVWMVLLALLVLAAAGWYFFLRPSTANAPTAATPEVAPATPPAPNAPGAATTPAPATAPATGAPSPDSALRDSAAATTSGS